MSRVIRALAYVREVNGDSTDSMRIHGVNLSVGYEFDPQWFACGQSPLCMEVDKLVRSGVVVVVAAGNSGYGTLAVTQDAPTRFGLPMTINDPGNAELAITVGSTHRDAPHTYGVSYFSSKGPTGDGRRKPDLVAPGERITSVRGRDNLDAASWPARARRHRGLRRGERHEHGRAARLRRHRGVPVGAPRVHRAARARSSSIFVDSATPLGRARRLRGRRAARPDAGPAVDLTDPARGDTMTEIAGLPFWELTFDADGDPDAAGGTPSWPSCRARASPTWSSSRTAGTTTAAIALRLYERFFGAARRPAVPADRPVIVGLAGVCGPRSGGRTSRSRTSPRRPVPVRRRRGGRRRGGRGDRQPRDPRPGDARETSSELFPAATGPLRRDGRLLDGPPTEEAQAEFHGQLTQFAQLAGAAGDDGEDGGATGRDPAEPGMLQDDPTAVRAVSPTRCSRPAWRSTAAGPARPASATPSAGSGTAPRRPCGRRRTGR